MTPEQRAADDLRRAIASVVRAENTLYPLRNTSGRLYQAHALLSATPLRLALETLGGPEITVRGLEVDDAKDE